jgi:hypothetical protein
MPSPRQIAASRANGAKSHGPTTSEGKRQSSRNSIRHGLLSKTPVLEGESAQDFAALLASYRAEHRPETTEEQALVDNMALADWRQRRIHNLEASVFADHITDTAQAFIAFQAEVETNAPQLLNRYAARFYRLFHKSLAALLALRAAKPQPVKQTKHIPAPVTPSGLFGNSTQSPKIAPAQRFWQRLLYKLLIKDTAAGAPETVFSQSPPRRCDMLQILRSAAPLPIPQFREVP